MMTFTSLPSVPPDVHRINHVPNVWMFHRARHGSTL